LTSITFGASLQRITGSTLINCSNLVTVRIESNLSSIGSDAFKGCSSLKNMTYLGVARPSYSSGVFDGCNDLTCVVVTSDYTSGTFCGKPICDISSLSSSFASLSSHSESSGNHSMSGSFSSHSQAVGSHSASDGFIVEVTLSHFLGIMLLYTFLYGEMIGF